MAVPNYNALTPQGLLQDWGLNIANAADRALLTTPINSPAVQARFPQFPVVNGTGVVRVTASVGAAAFPQSADTEKDALVAAADSALYRAKRLGKNRVVRAG